ncbi:hypothetical protein YC2023_079910 [Brassica napus]
MEMKRMVLFMVMMLTIGNLMVESKVTNRSFQLCFKMCFNICIIGPPRDKFGCFGKCTRECTGKKIEINCVSSQDPNIQVTLLHWVRKSSSIKLVLKTVASSVLIPTFHNVKFDNSAQSTNSSNLQRPDSNNQVVLNPLRLAF